MQVHPTLIIFLVFSLTSSLAEWIICGWIKGRLGVVIPWFCDLPTCTDGIPAGIGNNYAAPIYGYTPATGSGGQNRADSWNGDVYKIDRQQVMEANQCYERITVSWHNTNQQRKFRLKCLPAKCLRSVFHEKSLPLLIIGSPGEDFCALSTKENEYYYKLSNGEWYKGSIQGGVVNDQKIPPEEVGKAVERVLKWKEAGDTFNSRIKAIVGPPEERYLAEMKNIENLVDKEKKTHAKNEKKINKLRKKESDKEEAESKKIDQMIDISEMDKQMKMEAQNREETRKQTANNEIQRMTLDEKNRHELAMMDLQNKKKQVQDKYQQETQNFGQQIDSEKQRFKQEFNNLIRNGY